MEKAEEIIKEHQDIFGKKLFLEIQKHPKIEGDAEVRSGIIKLSKNLTSTCSNCRFTLSMRR